MSVFVYIILFICYSSPIILNILIIIVALPVAPVNASGTITSLYYGCT